MTLKVGTIVLLKLDPPFVSGFYIFLNVQNEWVVFDRKVIEGQLYTKRYNKIDKDFFFDQVKRGSVLTVEVPSATVVSCCDR